MDCNRRFILGAAAALAGAGAAPGPAAAAQARSAGGDRKARDGLKALAAYVDRHRADWGIPGLTVAVVDAAGFEGYVTSGLADVARAIPVGPDHLFQIGSISKMFTALAAWSLIEEGRLSLDASLATMLKGIRIRGGAAITLRHLLDHTAGLPADSEIFPEGGLWTGFAPGARWSYSNCGFVLAGMMIAAAGGAPCYRLVEERVLRKLGMRNSVPALQVADRARYAQGYEPALTDRLNPRPGPMTPAPWVDSDSPAGAIAATAGDMAVFLRFMLGLANGSGGGVIADDTARRFLADPVAGWGEGARYGNGVAHVEIDGRRYLHHTGGMVSFSSSMHVDAEAGVAAFASANVHYSLNYRPRQITAYACEILRAAREGRAAPGPKPTKPTLEKPERFAGRYQAADGDAFEIAASADAIRLKRNGRDSPMQSAAGLLFATLEPDFAVTGVVFDVEGDRAARAWIGEKEYARDPARGCRPPAPPELRRLAGRYDNDDRWAGPLTVCARDGGLFVGNIEPLFPLKDGSFRLGAEIWSPERIAFSGFVNGRPERLLYSGTPYARRFS